MKLIDLTGRIFDRLKVLERDSSVHGRVKWICECSCGKTISVGRSELQSGDTKSCGCLAKELTIARNITHGESGTPEYGIWSAMKNRCNNSNVGNYKNYGGRGIQVCNRWLNSFENFIQDMGYRPTPQHTLERENVNGDYCPTNCRWATYQEQARNKRNNVFLTIDGSEEKLVNLVDQSGISRDTILSRIKRGYSPEDAVSKPVEFITYTFNGMTRTLKEWSVVLNIDYKVLHNRIVSKGWSLEKAFTQPLRKSTMIR